jgi:hypothetical protein
MVWHPKRLVMNLNPLQRIRIRLALGLRPFAVALLLAAWALAGDVFAQEKPQLLMISYSPSSTDARAVSGLSIRPNIEQPIFFFVNNPSGDAGKFAVVVAGVRAEVTFAKDEKIKLARFLKQAPPPAAGAGAPPAAGSAAPPAAPKLAWVDLEGAPAKVSVQLFQEGVAEPIESKDLAAELYLPANYLAKLEPAKYSSETNELSVDVRVTKFDGPPSTVELVLLSGPGRIPGLKTPLSGDAELRAVLGRDGKARLFARGLKLTGGNTRGQFYLNVDGYQHAKVFDVDFAETDRPITALEGKERYRILAQDSAPSGAKVPVRIEVDESGEPYASLELALGRGTGAAFEKNSVVLLRGSRSTKTRFAPGGPDGSLLFQIEVNDWTVEIDTAGATGKRVLRIARLDANGEVVPGMEQTKEIILDGTPPEEVQFRDPPATALQGASVPFKATGKDDESGIREVVFFFGKPPADGKIPPTLDTYTGTKDVRGIWTANVPIPYDKKGPAVVSVQFVNNAGLSTFASTALRVVDPNDPKAAASPGRIEGKVFEGDRPQANLEVVLKDDKGKDKDKAKTKEDGTFAFEDVAPGNYSVATSKEASVTKGESAVKVVSDKTAIVEVKLFR